MNFECTNCKIEIKKLFKAESAIKEFNCPKCNNHANIVRKPKDSHTLVYETVDSGIQARKVTQLAGAPDMLKERADIDTQKKLKNELKQTLHHKP